MSRRTLLCLAFVACASDAGAKEAWATYRNTRYGTSLQYPKRFRPGRPPDNDDGQGFTAPDGAALRAWGALNVQELDPAALESSEREHHDVGENIHGAERGEGWFSFVGRRGPTDFFYRHYLLSHGNTVINAFDIDYPQDLKAEYDPIAVRMATSLRPGRGYQVKGAP